MLHKTLVQMQKSDHHVVLQINAELERLEQEECPTDFRCAVSSIGYTYEGREINMLSASFKLFLQSRNSAYRRKAWIGKHGNWLLPVVFCAAKVCLDRRTSTVRFRPP